MVVFSTNAENGLQLVNTWQVYREHLRQMPGATPNNVFAGPMMGSATWGIGLLDISAMMLHRVTDDDTDLDRRMKSAQCRILEHQADELEREDEITGRGGYDAEDD